nr:S8 family serine peptidase [Halobacterium zhouii]
MSGLALGAGTGAASSAENQRFLVDLTAVDRSDVPNDVEIIHDVSEVDLLAARGDPSSVPGAASTMPEVTAHQDDNGPAIEHGGPKANNHNFDGTASNTELQWDKRVQDVGDLTDKPDDEQTVHDTTKGAGTRIAVVDSGVYDAHPDLEDVVNDELSENFTTDRYDWRPNGAGSHGTHVAGIIAGTNSNDGPDGGILGTAPETEIVSHRIFSGVKGEGAYLGDVIAALVSAADKGCDAANFSVGYGVAPTDESWVPIVREAYRRFTAYAREKGMVFVNSAGNSGANMTPEETISLPTEVEGTFGVSATGPIGCGWGSNHDDNEEKWLTGDRLEEPTTQPAFYTNYGDAVDVSAAGGNADLDVIGTGVPWYNDLVFSSIYTTDENGDTVAGYGWKAGTSMAAPQVAGAVALVRSLRPDASVDEVESLIQETASDAEEGETYHGAGHLDLERLVTAAE